MREFNVTGNCVKSEHYMVDISQKLKSIKALVDKRKYFTINRARQYGKTTTLYHLQEMLLSEYVCLKISFEGICDNPFSSSQAFCEKLLKQLALATTEKYPNINIAWIHKSVNDFEELGERITEICREHKIVLLIDEVDKSSDNQIFLNFLGVLRNKFLERNAGVGHTFHSVILAGVHDIKNIKRKMVASGTHMLSSGEGNYNSPWNIATDFEVDMSFNPAEIATMLTDYESEYATNMNISEISQEIYDYTSGYPFLVSRICKIIDEKLNKDWSVGGLKEAIKRLLDEANTLFDDIYKNLEDNKELSDFIYEILILGERYPFTIYDSVIMLGNMYGFLKKEDGKTVVSNKIFELLIAEHFIVKDLRKQKKSQRVDVDDVVENGKFDLETCLIKFAAHYHELFSEQDEKFLERHGRLLFLSFLKPLINGVGFYHIETHTRNLRRMDVVLDYGNEQFIIELKIWYGDKKHAKAYDQLLEYMSAKDAKTGYLLTFDFRKDTNKICKAEWVDFDDGRRIFDVIV